MHLQTLMTPTKSLDHRIIMYMQPIFNQNILCGKLLFHLDLEQYIISL
jgi:hypothetical protein